MLMKKIGRLKMPNQSGDLIGFSHSQTSREKRMDFKSKGNKGRRKNGVGKRVST